MRSRKRCFKASHGTLSLISDFRPVQKANWVRSRKRESLACFPCRVLPTCTVLPCLPGNPTQHCPACQRLRNRPGPNAMPFLACLRYPPCQPSCLLYTSCPAESSLFVLPLQLARGAELLQPCLFCSALHCPACLPGWSALHFVTCLHCPIWETLPCLALPAWPALHNLRCLSQPPFTAMPAFPV